MTNRNYNAEDLCNHESIAAVIYDEDDRVLMQKHSKYGFLTIPIGKVKEDQSIEDALYEEVLAECGINILDVTKLAVETKTYDRPLGKINVPIHLFEISTYFGTPYNREPDKHEFQRFMKVEEFLYAPFISDATVMYLKHVGYSRERRLKNK